MSNIRVEVVSVDKVSPHPRADRLEVATVLGTQTVIPKGQFSSGDKAIFFPPDILIPEFMASSLGVANYLKHAVYPGEESLSKCRIGACRLRGQPSYGFLVEAAPTLRVGEDVSAFYKAVKYEPPPRVSAGDALPDHPAFHRYTNIQHYWKYPDAIPEGTPVRITEKIHGTNCRLGLIAIGGGEFEFMCGSNWIRRSHGLYWEPLGAGVIEFLTHLCDEKNSVILFGEIYGPGIQDMDYGGRGFRVFDIAVNGEYLPWHEVEMCGFYGIDTVPLLYEGPFYKPLVEKYTYGPTSVGEPRCAFKGREGIVITPLNETYAPKLGCGRMILKSVSADYLDRKGGEDNE